MRSLLVMFFILTIASIPIIQNSFAEEDDILCTMVYEPVCSLNGLTYSNMCMLNAANGIFAYEGECTTQSEDDTRDNEREDEDRESTTSSESDSICGPRAVYNSETNACDLIEEPRNEVKTQQVRDVIHEERDDTRDDTRKEITEERRTEIREERQERQQERISEKFNKMSDERRQALQDRYEAMQERLEAKRDIINNQFSDFKNWYISIGYAPDEFAILTTEKKQELSDRFRDMIENRPIERDVMIDMDSIDKDTLGKYYVGELGSTANSAAKYQFTGIIRDFSASHPNMEKGCSPDCQIHTGIVGPLGSSLDVYGKPVFHNSDNDNTLTNSNDFNQWYRTIDGVNTAKSITLVLEELDRDSGKYSFNHGTSFFPIDNDMLGNEGKSHNYHFTMELHSQLEFDKPKGSENLTYVFYGDDDVWVYVNKMLVLDIGGVHPTLPKTFTASDLIAEPFNLQPNTTYDLDIFFAERQTGGSNFGIYTIISDQNDRKTYSIDTSQTSMTIEEQHDRFIELIGEKQETISKLLPTTITPEKNAEYAERFGSMIDREEEKYSEDLSLINTEQKQELIYSFVDMLDEITCYDCITPEAFTKMSTEEKSVEIKNLREDRIQEREDRKRMTIDERAEFFEDMKQRMLDRRANSVTPHDQVGMGISTNDIVCSDDRLLVIKVSNNMPQCVSDRTSIVLFERGLITYPVRE